MVKYRVAIWSFLKLTALYFTMSDIVHSAKFFFLSNFAQQKIVGNFIIFKIKTNSEFSFFGQNWAKRSHLKKD